MKKMRGYRLFCTDRMQQGPHTMTLSQVHVFFHPALSAHCQFQKLGTLKFEGCVLGERKVLIGC